MDKQNFWGSAMMTRGERLNNPGNIKISTLPWVGKISPSSDATFEEFDIPENGMRAIAKIIINYFRLYGLSTLQEIIGRWAPSSENDTSAYISDVAKCTGYDQGESLNILDPDVLASLVTAIIHHENGEVIYSVQQIADGVNRALNGVEEVTS
jgi:hypothetical protein